MIPLTRPTTNVELETPARCAIELLSIVPTKER
jgi:hypothetical protein